MSAADTKYELEQAQLTLINARKDYRSAMEERNRLLLKARKEGVRPAELVKLTGLTSARIAQLKGTGRRKR